MTLVTVDHLHKQFGSTLAVNDVSFTLQKGRCTSLLGPNGAGKTTTLKLLTGLLQPTAGTLRFAGLDGDRQDRRSLIGYLPQYPAFYNWMTALEFLEYAGKLCGLRSKEAKKRGGELLELVGLADAAKRRTGGFSGGMKQRLGIAQALVQKPSLLILDEPVSALDPIGRREILELIRSIKQHTTVLFSTHVLHDAEEISDDVLIMRQGQIAVSGSLVELRQQYREQVIRVVWEGAPGIWAEGLSERLPGVVSGISVEGQTARISVAHMEAAMPRLLAELAQSPVPVSKIEASSSSLEELFMKVVGV